MTFFYNLNKKLDEIRATPETTHKQLNERDEGKPGKNFAKISADAAKRYGSKEAGDRVAGAVRAKLAKQGKLEENAAAGYSPEMQARIKTATPQQLAQMAQELAGGPAQYQSELKMLQQAKAELSGQMQEGFVDAAKQGYQTVKQGAQAALQAIGNTMGHGSDEDMIRDLQKKAGVPVTGKVPAQQPGQNTTTAGQQPMSEDDMEEAYAPSPGNIYDPYGDEASPEQHKAYQDELNLYKTPGAHPALASKGMSRAQSVHDRLKNVLAKKPGVAEEGGTPMTPKQKKFAKLAPPEDKITFADKIAGAKKEVDEMLGDVAAEAMKNALRGGQKKLDKNKNGKLDAMDFEILRKGARQETDEGWDDMMKDVKGRMGQMKTGEKKKTSKGEVEKTATGIRHTRSYDAKTGETDTGDDSPAAGEKRGRGRPKKTDKAPERVTAKAYKHKGGRKSMEEGADYSQAQQIYNELADIRAVAKKAQMGGAFPQGFASRLESALWAAMTLLKNQQPADAQVRERKLSSSEKEEREDIVKGMKKNKGEFKKRYGKRGEEVMYATATKMAKERGPGNPDRKKKEKTEESGTVAGSVAPAAGGKSKGNSLIGKGIYDSLNRDLEAMISESMNVSVNMSQDEHGEPHKNITVSAEGEAAEQLAQLLNLAGMSAQQDGDTGCGCDTDPCSCEELDENQPDWPTNAETTGEDDPLMRRWAGGLNGPKSTGQADGAPPALQPQRQGVMGEDQYKEDLRRMMEAAGIQVTDEMLDEDWKSKLAAAGTAAAIGATGLGMMGTQPGTNQYGAEYGAAAGGGGVGGSSFSQLNRAQSQVDAKADAFAKASPQFKQELQQLRQQIDQKYGDSPMLQMQKQLEGTKALLAKYQANEDVNESATFDIGMKLYAELKSFKG